MTDQNDTGGRNSVMEGVSKALCKSLVANGRSATLDLVVGLGCLEIFIGKLNKENAITSDGGYDNFDDTMEDAAKNLKFDDDDWPEKFFFKFGREVNDGLNKATRPNSCLRKVF